MSVYPTGVKQVFRDTLTVANGKVTLINHPCVVKYISAAPTCSRTIDNISAPNSEADSVALVVYDGTSIIMKIAGSGIANYLCSNHSILIPADGLRIKDYLEVECEDFDTSSPGSDSEKKECNISVVYQ